MKKLNSIAIASLLLMVVALSFGATNQAWADDPPAITDTSAVGELAYWNKIKGSGDQGELKLYLTTFPDGMFHELAMQKYIASGGDAADLGVVQEDTKVTTAEPADIEPEVILPKSIYKVKKRKAANFKPPSTYKRVKKYRAAVGQHYVAKRKVYQPKQTYVKKQRKAAYKAANRAPKCRRGYYSNGRCVVAAKPKYQAVKYKKPAYVLPDQASGGDGGGGGGGGGGWGN